MNTSFENVQPGQQPAASASKPLWAAVGILGVAVLAMGGAMLYQQRTPAPVATVAPAAQQVPPQVAAAATTDSAADDLVAKPVAAAKPAPVPAPAPAPAKKVVKPTNPAPAPSYAGVSPAPSPAPVAAARVCAVCGAVESVTPVERSTKPAGVGVGAVAGGVLGAVLGNQVGHGNGRAAATVLGAVGGGFAGNAIEKNVRKETVYQVGVRMEDGTHRVVEVTQAPSVGSRVTLEGSSIRTSDGVTYSAPAPVAPRVTQPQPVYQGQ